MRDSAALLDASAGPDAGAPYAAVPPLRPFLDDYSTLSAIYQVVSNAYAYRVYVDRAFQKKTNELVQKHIGAQFAGEESMMEESRYLFRAEHARQHRRFEHNLARLAEDIRSETENAVYLAFRIKLQLMDWTINHSIKEYVRGDIHTNTIEGFFSIFKRGMKGVYQHCSEKHLHRYLAEFDFRYNERKVTDGERAESALRGTRGKRLTYRVVDPTTV